MRLWRLFVLLLSLLCSACAAAAPRQVRGVIDTDQHWSGQVAIRGDVVIAAGATVQLAPGTELIFFPAGDDDLYTDHPHFHGSELIVRGRLLAEGTPAAPIRFQYIDPTAPAGSWGGINLESSPLTRFRYCQFSQADSAIHSQESQVFIEDSLFMNNRVGIRFHSSEILIEGNLLRDNGVAIRFHFGSPVICHNEIRDNDKGFFITAFPRDYRIEYNNILHNRRAAVVLGEEVPDDVLMPRNYWGSNDSALIEAELVDGRSIDYLGKVLYLPVAAQPLAAGEQRCSP